VELGAPESWVPESRVGETDGSACDSSDGSGDSRWGSAGDVRAGGWLFARGDGVEAGDGEDWAAWVTASKLLTAFWVQVLGSGPPAKTEAAASRTARAPAAATPALIGPIGRLGACVRLKRAFSGCGLGP
jgi:hypothetical protein